MNDAATCIDSHAPIGRREFLGAAAAAIAVPALFTRLTTANTMLDSAEPLFTISLAQWSLHRALQAGQLDPLDFPRTAKEDYGIDGVEYVNSFYKDHGTDRPYFDDLKGRAAALGVTSLLIMVDGEGALGAPEKTERAATIENHIKWLDAAKQLGCHSIRVNAQSSGTYDEQQKLASDGLRGLTERAAPMELNVIVENHGGLSSNGAWLAGVMRMVDHPRCGTLPDFGNFCLDWSRQAEPDAWYDRYKGVTELMPFAKAVSAKSHDFDASGNESRTDYRKMMKIVLDAGYRGRVGIEYEGSTLSEPEGIRATRSLLEAVRSELAGQTVGQ